MNVILYCDSDKCVNCRNNTCQRGELTLYDGQCEEYEDITEGPDYQEEYFIACEYRPEGDGDRIQYRQVRKGKRVEIDGDVYYTRDDIRDGIAFAAFTDAITGRLLSGKDLLSDICVRMLKEKRGSMTPVMDMPWMDEQYDAPPVPHATGGEV